MQNFDILGLKNLLFFYTLLKVLKQGISSSISLAPAIINLKIVLKKFLGAIKLFKTQTLYIYKFLKVVIAGKYKNFMLKAFYQVLKASIIAKNSPS